MVRIMTDSAADFEPAELEAMNVTCIPLAVTFGEREYVENQDMSKALFYELLESTKEFPRTSQPSPQSFAAAYEEAKAAGDETVVITLSSGLSGTHQSAVLAKDLAEYEKCYVVDSLNGTGGERALVEYAVKLRDLGKSAREIAGEVETLRSRVVLYACMDTLEYLYRGGRISSAVYRIGSFAHIKPILHVDAEGRAEIPAKAIGIRKGMDYLCKRLETQPMDKKYPLYVMFTGNRANGEALAQRLRGLGYEIPDSRIVNVGAAVGAHIGANACGIVYIRRPRE